MQAVAIGLYDGYTQVKEKRKKRIKGMTETYRNKENGTVKLCKKNKEQVKQKREKE